MYWIPVSISSTSSTGLITGPVPNRKKRRWRRHSISKLASSSVKTINNKAMERAQAERTSQPTRTQQHPCYCLRRSGPRQIWACIAVVLLSTSSTACYAFGMLRPALYTSTAISTTTTVASRGDRCAWPASLREIRSSGLSSVAGHCAVFVGCGGLVATNRDTLHHRAEVYKLYMSSIEVVASGDRRTVDVGGETNPIGAFRKPRGNDLRRDDSGLPVEKVYAPRASH